uniref:Uncharacterized protein n=1 Tax=Romanomermis culicivorax TaxID=13658 RepID=A0A915IFD8_ROMCU
MHRTSNIKYWIYAPPNWSDVLQTHCFVHLKHTMYCNLVQVPEAINDCYFTNKSFTDHMIYIVGVWRNAEFSFDNPSHFDIENMFTSIQLEARPHLVGCLV